MATIETLLVRIEADTERLRRELARADTTVAGTAEKIERSVARARRSFDDFGRAAGGARQRMSQLTIFAQQAGFQIGDVATQISMGGNAMRALTVQGSQLVSMFGGPWGAALGAAVAVGGALAATLWNTRDASKGAEDATYDYSKALKDAEAFVAKINNISKTRVQLLQEEKEGQLRAAEAAIVNVQKQIQAQRALMQAAQLADPETAFGVGGVAALQIEALNEELEKAKANLTAVRAKLSEAAPALQEMGRQDELRERERFFDMLDQLEEKYTKKLQDEEKRRLEYVHDVEQALLKVREERAAREVKLNEQAADRAIRAAERASREIQRRTEPSSQRLIDLVAA